LTLDRGRIRLADVVLVYLERTLAPPDSLPAGTLPRSHGLAPAAAVGPDSVIASVAPGEAVWLGFQAIDPATPTTVRVRTTDPEPLDVELRCPPDHLLPRLFGPGGLTIAAAGASVVVRLVGPEAYERATGEAPKPLDPDASYKGWRLP
jgi:hypothetical protein